MITHHYALLHSPVTSSLLRPNIFLSTLSSKALSIRSSLNVSDQVSHPYNTKIIVDHIWNTSLLLLTGNQNGDRGTKNEKRDIVHKRILCGRTILLTPSSGCRHKEPAGTFIYPLRNCIFSHILTLFYATSSLTPWSHIDFHLSFHFHTQKIFWFLVIY